MKNKIFLIIPAIMILIAFVFGAIYLYMYVDGKNKSKNENENENNIYVPIEEVNLISNVDLFLFTQEKVKLFYEGGPVHWGSRTVTFTDIKQNENSKIVNLHVIDESDMKGEDPKKEWNQKWEVNSDGELYIDNVLMLKSPIVVGNEWNITNYSPIIDSSKTYTAKVKITSVISSLNDSNIEVNKVNTSVTINDIKTVDGGIYTETRVFESALGLSKVTITEPTISDFILSYWFSSSKSID